jgi:putative transposase
MALPAGSNQSRWDYRDFGKPGRTISLMVTPAAKREAVAHLRSAFDMSERRACRTIGCVRMTVRYRCRRPDDAALRQRLRALAHERRRFGYRRLHVLLRREGFTVNHKRLFRLYREERLMVRRRGGRKRALGTRAPMLVPQWPNDRWSLDFVSDQFIDGRRMRILVVVDDCTRECLALVPDTSISGTRVARELDRLLVAYGKPETIVSDNGTELTSTPSCGGPMTTRSNGITSPRGSRYRTPSPNPSSAACAMSCSMRRCSGRYRMPARRSMLGAPTTITTGRTRGSAG